jgi:hypothetical protein
MSRWMAGGVLSALALAGTTVLPATSVADDEPQVGEFQGEADLSPSPVVAGQQVTASDASCFEGTNAIWWSLRAYGEVVPSATGTVPLAGDGSWELSFAAPNETGEWLFFAVCLPPAVAAPNALIAHIDEIRAEGPDVELMDAWGVDGFLYYAHLLEVVAPSGPTTTTTTVPVGPTTTTVPVAPSAPSAPPAAPVPGDPDFTG